MQGSTVKKALLAIVIASALPVLACGDDDTPTSPTQPGPTVSTPAPDPTPAPTSPPPPAPQPPVVDSTVTSSGFVSTLQRSGPDDINATFRLNDTTIVHADGNTAVIDGSTMGNTSHLRLGQAVTVTGVQRNGFVQASQIVIDSR